MIIVGCDGIDRRLQIFECIAHCHRKTRCLEHYTVIIRSAHGNHVIDVNAQMRCQLFSPVPFDTLSGVISRDVSSAKANVSGRPFSFS